MKKYLSLVKFSHTIFALPFALVGFTMGVVNIGVSDWWLLLLQILTCMVTARNSAMGFNRYLDRDIDKKNPRTANREIPAGLLSVNRVMIFIAINILIFILAAFWINPLCGYLAPVALLVLLGYSYMKRVSALCHFVLGLALGIAPSGAYIAVTGEISVAVIILSLIVMFWTAGFDILYALADEEFDKEQELHSIPVLLGRKRAMNLSYALHFTVMGLLALFYIYLFGEEEGLSAQVCNISDYLYFAAALIFTVLLIWQHSIISPTNLKRLNAAFFTLNGIASILFALFTIGAIVLG